MVLSPDGKSVCKAILANTSIYCSLSECQGVRGSTHQSSQQHNDANSMTSILQIKMGIIRNKKMKSFVLGGSHSRWQSQDLNPY